MAEQERKHTQRRDGQDQDTADIEVSAQGDELTERIDDLLDEIDTVLEENAEEFVKNYVQKGGE
jgi:prokaryotic ubiquitin-like protein Pup